MDGAVRLQRLPGQTPGNDDESWLRKFAVSVSWFAKHELENNRNDALAKVIFWSSYTMVKENIRAY
jgi:hypothetical protein